VLRTDTPTFAAYLEARRNRREEWFKVPPGTSTSVTWQFHRVTRECRGDEVNTRSTAVAGKSHAFCRRKRS